MWQVEMGMPQFLEVIDRSIHDLEQEVQRIPPPAKQRRQQIDVDLVEIDGFTAALEALANMSNPFHALTPVAVAAAGPVYECLSHGNWDAFFRADRGNRVLKGILVRDRRNTAFIGARAAGP